MEDNRYRVCADINVSAVRDNILNLKKCIKPGTKTCAVIKADGYGHGAVPIARKIADIVDFFAVATIDEALNLRVHDIKHPLLILGFTHPENTMTAIRNDIRMTVFSFDLAEQIAEYARDLGKKAKIHIKLDTGMSRIGFAPTDESVSVIKKIYEMPELEIEGIFTHFYGADEDDVSSAYDQLGVFKAFSNKLNDMGIKIPIRHCANSAAATMINESDMDMVRLGISIYGLYPSKFVNKVNLFPALSLRSHIVMLKDVDSGISVSYGATYITTKPTRIATIPVGYADGYFRSLSNKGWVMVNGKKAPVIGRVCMDQFMVDVSGIDDVKVGQPVTLIGDGVTAEALAEAAGTINYELVCGLGRRVPRVYYFDGKEFASKDYFYDRY